MTGYHIDLYNGDGSGWHGTFYRVVKLAVEDILDDGPWEPAEVTLSDGAVLTGKLEAWTGEDNFTITERGELPRVVEVDDVVRFRA